jgi:hypothetical protein
MPRIHVMTSGPVVVFYLDDNDYLGEIDELIGEIVRLSGTDDPPFCFVRSGLLLTLGDRVTSTEYTPLKDGSRLWSSSTISVSSALERQEKAELLDSLDFISRSDAFTLRSTLGVSYFCLSFSDIDADVVQAAIMNIGISANVAALARFDLSNAICFGVLWRTLSISHILTAGYVLESLQEAMLDFGFDEGGMHNADWSTQSRPWPNPGFFSDELGENQIFVERRLTGLSLPPDPAYPRQRTRPRHPSPVERALNLAPTRIKKINPRDNPDLPGFFSLEEPLWQWPDPEQAYRKMEDYCLKVGHSQNKWKGFESIGYLSQRPGDSRFLSYALCSALIRGPFTPFDIKMSADGTLEFAVNVVIPCRGGRFRNVCAAWNVQAGRDISLSSAFVSEPGKHASALIVQPPAEVADGREWSDALAWATNFAAEYVSGVTPDTREASGYLWLPHSDAVTSEFASWCRRTSGLSGGIFRRRAWGGRCTQLVSPFGFMGISRTVASLRAMQYCLGVIGVRTLIEVSNG